MKVGTGSITGKITYDEGKQIPNAIVSIGNICAITDIAGNYTLENVPLGEQDIVASASGFSSVTKRENVTPDQIITIDFSLIPDTGAEGSFWRNQLQFLLQVDVSLIPYTGTERKVFSCPGGQPFIPCPPGPIIIPCTGAGRPDEPCTEAVPFIPIPCTAGKPQEPCTEAVPIVLATGTITGTVTSRDLGDPLTGAELSVVNTSIASQTNSSGIYTLSNVRVGERKVTAEMFRFISETKTVTVNLGQSSVLDFKLEPLPGTITGTVTSMDLGDPLIGAKLSVVNTSISSQTNSSGIYTLSNVHRGVQTVKAEMDEFFPETSTVTVNAGQSSVLYFKLKRKPECPMAKPDQCQVGGPERCQAGKPDKQFTAGKSDNYICLSGKPEIGPDSFQKPEVKPRGSEKD